MSEITVGMAVTFEEEDRYKKNKINQVSGVVEATFKGNAVVRLPGGSARNIPFDKLSPALKTDQGVNTFPRTSLYEQYLTTRDHAGVTEASYQGRFI